MPITTLPAVPTIDDPQNFAAEADAFLGALPTFVTEVNTLATQVQNNAATASTAATSATTAASTVVESVIRISVDLGRVSDQSVSDVLPEPGSDINL